MRTLAASRRAAPAAGAGGRTEDYWSLKAPGTEECSARAQLLCLGTYLRDEDLARRAYHVWTALSRAAHFHPYELPPTREELMTWQDVVQETIEATEEGWR